MTLAVIAKNEAENVKQLTESVKGLFDQYVLVDTGSTDQTVENAKALGWDVHHFTWINDFAAARNFAFSKATSEFIMWLDLDDVLENQEGFEAFKKDVLNLADYWIAPYHYSSDKNGKPICSFARERLVRRNLNMTWEYPIHEGIKPVSTIAPVRVQATQAWVVRHKRTDEDLKKDRLRNLTVFEDLIKKGPLDARMQYYYGKELFEAGKPLDGLMVLSQAISSRELEVHDRILGMQYACYASIQLGQFEKALELATQGTILAPNRAEFHCIIGDCFVKWGRLIDAVPSYEAAKACKINAPHLSGIIGSVIFHQEDCYTVYPRNNLARIYAHLGEFERAISEARQSAEEFKNEEGKAILEEVQRIHKLAGSYKDAKPCDDIVISCPPVSAYEFDPGIAEKKAMGGSETALIEIAYWLKKHSDRNVIVFNMRNDSQTFEGVEYRPASTLAEYMAKHRPYLHIAWRHTTKITDAPTFVWSHDLMTPGVEALQNYTKVMCLTPFHKRYMQITQGVSSDKIYVTRNGLKAERFAGEMPGKDPYRFVFGSSPDRGLDRCIRVLDKVREKYPQVTLHIHYGFEHFYKTGNQDLIRLADLLKQMIAERSEWITYHGATQQAELMESYKKSAYVCQPSDWIETSCISAMEFLACGVYPIFRKVGGVADTLAEAQKAGMATLVDSDCITELQYQLYVDATLKALDEKAFERVKIDPSALSWEKVALEWLRDLPKLAQDEEGALIGAAG